MKVTIYGAEWCSYCIRAKRLAERLKLDVDFVEVEGPNDDIILSLFPQATTIPQITVDGRHIGGYDEFKELVTE